MATTTDQDFTFPISDPTNSPIDSPPLWRLSPAASPAPSYSQQTKLLENKATHVVGDQRKSCSYVEGGGLLKRLRMGCGGQDGQDDHDEEKMDMLWEDLNEEVCRKDGNSKMINLHNYSRGGQNKLMEFGCVPTSFRLVKNTDYDNKKVVKNGKKPSVVVLMKVFRKLFLLHHSQQSSSKKRP